MILYDASAFFAHMLDQTLDHDAFITDLSFYEVGNIVRKHHVLLKKINKEEADSFLTILSNWRNVLYLQQNDIQSMYDTSFNLDLTYYDAAYVFLAKKYSATLETLDKKIFENAKEFIEVKFLG